MPALRRAGNRGLGSRRAPREPPAGTGPGLPAAVEARSEEEQARLARLKWLAIVLPLAFLSVLHYLLHTVLEVFHDWPEILVLLGWVAAGVVIFSFGVFWVIGSLERRILEQNRQLSAVNAIAAASAENLELTELLDVALDKVLEIMSAKGGLIFVADTDASEPIESRHRGFSDELARRIQGGSLGARHLVGKQAAGSPPAIEDLLEQAHVAQAARAEGFRSVVGVPLVAEDSVTALLAVGARGAEELASVELEMLASIGPQLGLGVRNAVLFERSRQRNRELAALLAVGRAAASSLKLPELLAKALDAIVDVTSAETAEVWLATEGGELVLGQQRGIATEAFRERTRLRWGEGLPGLAAERGTPVVVHDLASEPRFVRKRVKELGFQTFCALPLRHGDDTVGVLAVAARDREGLSGQSERHLLEGIGERLAIAIENSRLHERVLDGVVLEERERIARELHDGMAQVLGYINTQTLAIRKHLASGRADDAEAQTEAMERAARELYTDVREAILGLRAPLSPRDGLILSLRAYLRGYSEMAEVQARLEVTEEAETISLPGSTEIQLMRIIQEALSNVRKHARAGLVTLRVEAGAERLTVRVADDGKGFASDRSVHTGWPRFGLQTMRERAEAIGGEFEIVSSAGQGTTVVVHVPLRTQVEAPA